MYGVAAHLGRFDGAQDPDLRAEQLRLAHDLVLFCHHLLHLRANRLHGTTLAGAHCSHERHVYLIECSEALASDAATSSDLRL